MGIAEVAVPPISLCSLSAAASRTKSSGSNGNSRALPRPPILIRVKSNKGRAQNRLDTRRDLMTNALLALLGGLLHSAGDCKPTQAFSFGISGPKEWLREQKKKTIYFLLGPIIASRDRLNRAYHLLSTSFSMTNESEIPFNNEYEEARRLVKVAARDCIPLDEGSFVAFQANAGVEVCTFRLVLKNAASLLDDMDPIKLKADASLNDLTSFSQEYQIQMPSIALERRLRDGHKEWSHDLLWIAEDKKNSDPLFNLMDYLQLESLELLLKVRS